MSKYFRDHPPTPTPWECKDWRIFAIENVPTIKVITDTAWNKATRTDLNKANAALIVRAVNAHAGLVEALGAVLYEIGRLEWETLEGADENVMKKAQAALKAVKGES